MHPNRRRLQLRILLLAVIGILLVVSLYMGGRWLEERDKRPEARGDHSQRQSYVPTVEYNGETYRQRQNLTSIRCCIDTSRPPCARLFPAAVHLPCLPQTALACVCLA